MFKKSKLNNKVDDKIEKNPSLKEMMISHNFDK